MCGLDELLPLTTWEARKILFKKIAYPVNLR